MALSGSFSGSVVSGNYKLRVDWSATQSVANNTSKITATMYLVQASGWSLNIGTRDDSTTTIAGTTYTWDSPAINNGGGKTTKLATVTSGNIAHNADGSKSVTISATFQLRATISGTYRGTITASATINLNDIPRATQPTLSSTSVNMGSAVTVTLPRASSGFTHDLAYSFAGSGYTSITTGAGSSYGWTVPDRASSIPNATSGKMTLRCITKSGSKTIGTKYAYLTAKVPSSVVPTVGTVSVAEATEGLAEQFGAYIRGKSALSVNIAASGAKGSTIKAYKSTLLSKTYTGKTWTSAVLTSAGSLTLKVQAQDSRGRWSAAKTVTVSVLDYAAPKIQAFSALRVDADGNPAEDGEYISAAYRYSVTSLGSKNTAAMTMEYKTSAATTWTTLLTGSALSANTTYAPSSPTFTTDNAFDLRLTVEDWFGASRTYTTELPSGAVVLDIRADGKGLGIGKTSEQEGIEFGWSIVDAVASMGSQSGQYRTHDGLLLQWGVASITPSASNTATTAVVTFPRAYTSAPVVMATPVTSVPENISVGVLRTADVIGDPLKGIGIVLTRSGTTTTGVQWLAIGKG